MPTLSDCRKFKDSAFAHFVQLYFKELVHLYNSIYLEINYKNIPIEFAYEPEKSVFVQINSPFVSLTSMRSARPFKGPLKCKSP